MKNTLEAAVHIGIFAIPFIVLIVSDSLFFPFITGKNFTFRILVEVIFAAWVLLACYDMAYRPKFSWILALFATLLGVMFFANILGEAPLKSFWSNFERMEGYVTLVHVIMFLVVAGSSLGVKAASWIGNTAVSVAVISGILFFLNIFSTSNSAALWGYPTGLVTIAAFALFGVLMWGAYTVEHTWDRFFNVTLGVAVLLSWYALAQFFGAAAISQGASWRIDGTLGNSTYMAVYTLFHIFIAALAFMRSHRTVLRSVYGVLLFTFVFILLQTGTRGAALGLAGGAFVTLLYIALFAPKEKKLRTFAIVSCLALVVSGTLFVTFRDSAFIQNDPRLARVADITLEEGKTRFTIWSMAFEGVKARPILGWGQSNYDYVFNTYYKPSLYAQETWFDRVHNIVLDWLVTGGFVGALCYFGIFGAAVWYIAVRPIIRRDETFTVVERGILLGLLSGYMFHNFFVFDNIVSYVFFAVMLAYIHGRVATPLQKIEQVTLPEHTVMHIYAPVVGALLIGIVYLVNAPGIFAAQDIIAAMRATDPVVRLEKFEAALNRNSFGNQEIREQMMQNAIPVLQSPTVSEAVKQQWFAAAERALLDQIEERPGDTRALYLLGTFYRMSGNFEKAYEQLETARRTSPRKQVLIFEQGFVALQERQFKKAQDFFKEAYDLAPEFATARVYYAMSALLNGEEDVVNVLLDTDAYRNAFAENDTALRMFYDAKLYATVIDMLERRKALHPEDAGTRVNLAAVYLERGEKAKAIAVIEEAIKDIPAFKAQGEAMLKELQ